MSKISYTVSVKSVTSLSKGSDLDLLLLLTNSCGMSCCWLLGPGKTTDPAAALPCVEPPPELEPCKWLVELPPEDELWLVSSEKPPGRELVDSEPELRLAWSLFGWKFTDPEAPCAWALALPEDCTWLVVEEDGPRWLQRMSRVFKLFFFVHENCWNPWVLLPTMLTHVQLEKTIVRRQNLLGLIELMIQHVHSKLDGSVKVVEYLLHSHNMGLDYYSQACNEHRVLWW